VSSALDLSQPRQRSQAVEELLPLLAAIGDRIVQAHYLQRLGRLAQVREPVLHQMLLRQRGKQGRGREAAAERETVAEVKPLRDVPEEHCLELLLRYPELRSEGLALLPDLFWQTENRELLRLWQRASDLEELALMIPPELQGHFEHLSGTSLPPFPPAVALERLRGSVGSLKKREIRQAKELAGAALAEREAEDGPASLEDLAAAAQASDSPTDEIGSGEASPTAALLLRDQEIGIKLHQSSKIEMGDEEGLTGNGPEVDLNG
jgi:DNA primase